MAVPVSGETRWIPQHLGPWRTDGDDIVHRPQSPHTVTRLQYQHIEPTVHDPSLGRTCIFDGSDYDQNESRRLNPVRDVMLSFEAQTTGNGELHLEADSCGDEFQLVLKVPSGRIELAHAGRSVRVAQAGHDPLQRRAELEWIVADGRVQFALAGRTLVQYDYRPAEGPYRDSTGLALGAGTPPFGCASCKCFATFTTFPIPGCARPNIGSVRKNTSYWETIRRIPKTAGGGRCGAALRPACSWDRRSTGELAFARPPKLG